MALRNKRMLTHPNFIRKAIVSPSQSSSDMSIGDHVVLAIYCAYRLAFWRPGDAHWSLFEVTSYHHRFYDIIFLEEQAYAVSDKLELVVLEFSPRFKIAYCPDIVPPKVTWEHRNVYLVESDRELLMVVRLVNKTENPCQTFLFTVYKLDLRKQSWVTVENLGDRALLLGAGCSTSFSGDGRSGFRGNCIYFTDDNF